MRNGQLASVEQAAGHVDGVVVYLMQHVQRDGRMALKTSCSMDEEITHRSFSPEESC